MTAQRSSRFRVHDPDPKYMTFVEHLSELRGRLIKCVAAIAAGSVAGWFLARPVIRLLEEPLKKHHIGNGQLIVSAVYGGFTLYLKVAIMIGFMFALPVTLWQAWAFVAPAFGAKANRVGPIVILSALLLFTAGTVTGYFVMPLAITFFAGFQGDTVKILPFASDYVGFISLVLIVFGISYELPLVLVSMAAIGMTSSRWLRSKRAHFFFGCYIFATVATPGADWISPLILGSILYVLFEISILISRFIGK